MKNIIVACFILVCSATFAQKNPTSDTKCQLEVNDILLQQSFDIDDPISEEARYIFGDMYEELNLIYKSELNDPKREEYIHDFNQTLKEASELNLNISMFQQDIDYVNNLTE